MGPPFPRSALRPRGSRLALAGSGGANRTPVDGFKARRPATGRHRISSRGRSRTCNQRLQRPLRFQLRHSGIQCSTPESNRALRVFSAALVPRELAEQMQDWHVPPLVILFSCHRAVLHVQWVAGESNPACPGKSRMCFLQHLQPNCAVRRT